MHNWATDKSQNTLNTPNIILFAASDVSVDRFMKCAVCQVRYLCASSMLVAVLEEAHYHLRRDNKGWQLAAASGPDTYAVSSVCRDSML